MVCLDTNILIGLLRGDEAIKKELKELYVKGENLSTTPLNAVELYHGAFKSGKAENYMAVRRLLDNLTLLNFDRSGSEIAGKLLNSLEKEGQKIGDFDTVIAAISIA
ncbi:MAG: type II toxin-antitoxin system VapC family toxin, partial [Candidatus Micrarchaeota archaeon]